MAASRSSTSEWGLETVVGHLIFHTGASGLHLTCWKVGKHLHGKNLDPARQGCVNWVLTGAFSFLLTSTYIYRMCLYETAGGRACSSTDLPPDLMRFVMGGQLNERTVDRVVQWSCGRGGLRAWPCSCSMEVADWRREVSGGMTRLQHSRAWKEADAPRAFR